jgi:ABC-2 type transport system ATP-binding protein
MSVAILVDRVCKIFDKISVVNELSFSIDSGEIFGLLGANGAGKSTTIRMLIGLTKLTQGRMEVAGYDVSKYPAFVKQNIGVVLQQISVDGDLTVWENLEFHGRMHHISNPRRQELIDRWLAYVELTDKKNALVKTLSGGMKRRVQIARALLHEPKILFLDEPTVGLDPQTRRRLWEIIKDLNRNGMTILLTTHYMEEVEFLCDRIGIMDGGKIMKLGKLAEFRAEYGAGLVVKQNSDRLDYQFFPTLKEANSYLDSLIDKTGVMVRASNLEDIFVEMTGHQLN